MRGIAAAVYSSKKMYSAPHMMAKIAIMDEDMTNKFFFNFLLSLSEGFIPNWTTQSEMAWINCFIMAWKNLITITNL